jgi:hypothetical protein
MTYGVVTYTAFEFDKVYIVKYYVYINPYIITDTDRLDAYGLAHRKKIAAHDAEEAERVRKGRALYAEAKECLERQTYFAMNDEDMTVVNERNMLMLTVLCRVVKLVHPTRGVFPVRAMGVVPMIYMHKHINFLVEVLFYGLLPPDLYWLVVDLARALRRVTARTFTNGEMRSVQRELLRIGQRFEEIAPLNFRQSVLHDVFVHLPEGMILAGPDFCHG